MKKSLKIVGIATVILSIIVILGILYFASRNNNLLNDAELVEKYDMLKDYKFRNSSVVADNVNSSKLFELTDGKLMEKTGSAIKDDDGFYCGDKKAEQIHYKSYSPGRHVDGGFYSIYVLDCEDIYWIAWFGDSGRTIYGPFNK